MKALLVESNVHDEVQKGIPVVMEPFPHLALGEKKGDAKKRGTWIPLGRRDADSIVVVPKLPCPRRVEGYAEGASCSVCGVALVPRPGFLMNQHLEEGEVDGSPVIMDVGIIPLQDGKHLVVAPRKSDDQALVLWCVSGQHAGTYVEAGQGATLMAQGSGWLSGRAARGVVYQALAIVERGGELRARATGKTVVWEKTLRWDGEKISVQISKKNL